MFEMIDQNESLMRRSTRYLIMRRQTLLLSSFVAPARRVWGQVWGTRLLLWCCYGCYFSFFLLLQTLLVLLLLLALFNRWESSCLCSKIKTNKKRKVSFSRQLLFLRIQDMYQGMYHFKPLLYQRGASSSTTKQEEAAARLFLSTFLFDYQENCLNILMVVVVGILVASSSVISCRLRRCLHRLLHRLKGSKIYYQPSS